MAEPEAISLIAAVIERAVLDVNSNEDCPYSRGGHKARDCAIPVVEDLKAFCNANGQVTADDVAEELMRVLGVTNNYAG